MLREKKVVKKKESRPRSSSDQSHNVHLTEPTDQRHHREATAEPVIKFRNYAPSDAGLKEAVMEAAALPDIETAV